ncbi:hypothetical protein V6N13_113851 [Hibiscus sabdariffa]
MCNTMDYMCIANETKLVVDTSRRKTLRINFDVRFLVVACSIPSLDAMGISREQSLDVKHGHGNVIEMRSNRIGILKIEKLLQRHGGKLKHYEAYSCSCYGSKEVDDQYYNFCEDVCEAYKNKG